MRTLLLLALGLCLATTVAGQDPLFTQVFASPLAVSPAFAGSADQFRAALTVRAQWVGLYGNYRTAAVAVDGPLGYRPRGRLSWGAQVVADQAGQSPLTRLYAVGMAAYEAPLTRSLRLRGGLGLGVLQSTFDYQRLFFPDQANGGPTADPLVRGGQTALAPTVQAGVLLFTPRWFVSLSGQHLNRPALSFGAWRLDTPLLWQAYGGLNLPLGATNATRERYQLRPALLYRHQGAARQLDAAVQLVLPQLTVGAWYRGLVASGTTSALALQLGLERGRLAVGYAYEFDLTALGATRTLGAHELVIAIRGARQRRSRPHDIPCPKF